MLLQTDRNPLLPALLAFAAGALTAGAYWLPAGNYLWPAALILVVAAALLLYKRPQAKFCFLAALLGLFFLGGLLHAGSFLTPRLPPNHLARLVPEKEEVTISGKLVGKPVFKDDKTRLLLDCDSLLFPAAKTPTATSGRVALTINASRLKGLTPGHDYLVRARLSLPDPPATPGVFDYAAHLAAEGIMVKGWVDSPVFIQAISPAPPRQPGLNPIFFLENFRLQFSEFLQARLAPEDAALYQALLLGDTGNLTPATLEAYRATGVMHILAISGSHLVVVAFLTTLAFRFVVSRIPSLLLRLPATKIALLLSFPVLLLYSGLAGFQPPVVRALIMAGIFMAAILIDRQWSSLNNLAIAAFCILIANPLSIRSASFQLSFAAAAAIILTMPALSAWRPEEKTHTPQQTATYFLISSMVISGAAFLATAPLALFHFNRLSLLGPISTLLITPFLCFWTLPLGLIGIAAQPFSPAASVFLLKLGIPGIRISEAIVTNLSSLPFSSFWLPTPTLFRMALAFALILMIFHIKRRVASILLLTGLALVLSGHSLLPARQAKVSEVSFLSVGNGSATVVESPGSGTILIDGGGPPSESFNAGERIIAPFLWHRQIRRIEQIVITHPHADHFNGLPFIIRRFRPKVLWLSEADSHEPGFNTLLEEAALVGCQIRIAGSGEVLLTDHKGFTLKCLANLALTEDQGYGPGRENSPDNPNNRGLILRLNHGDKAFLFPGDLEKEDEHRIIWDKVGLKADVLLLPHHGLNSSGSEQFVDTVAASYCLASTGKKEPFPPVQCRNRRAVVFSTARHGSVFFISNGKEISVKPYRGHNVNDTPSSFRHR